jgi:hypothetical protein
LGNKKCESRAYFSNTLGATKFLLPGLESVVQILKRPPNIIQKEKKKVKIDNYSHNTGNKIKEGSL